jgi:DNA-binding NarL/FixJ family response regulator
VTAILAASDEPFRNHAFERLVEAGYDDVRVVDLPATLEEALREYAQPLDVAGQPLVIVGGIWPLPRPFLRIAANAGALPVVLLQSVASEAEHEALEMGARAALQSDIPVESLAAALAAVRAGLIVLEPATDTARPSNTHRRRPTRGLETTKTDYGVTRGHPRNSIIDQTQRSSRPLTSREREILSLVASGTSNKGIARALTVSANTVKFHLAAVFDKLNASTRAEAVAEAIRRGQLSL